MKKRKLVRHGLFVGLVLIAIVVFSEPLIELFGRLLGSDLYSHILLIPLVSAYFVFINRKSLFSENTYSCPIGISIIFLSIVIYWIGKNQGVKFAQNDFLSVMMLGLVVWVEGSFFMCYGARSVRKAMFPLTFLVFMIPMPTIILDPMMEFLQTWSAHFSYGIFKAIGVPVFRDGFIFSLPGIDIEVAKQCSGIRSSLGLFITSILAGQLFLRTGWTRLALGLVVFPITIFKNAVRIVTISSLAVYIDPRFLTDSWLHKSGGIVFFALALTLLGPVLWVLVKLERRQREKPAVSRRLEAKDL